MFTYEVAYGIAGTTTVWTDIAFYERPMFNTTTLDESLDTGNIKLRSTTKLPLVPFLPLRIRIREDGTLRNTLYLLGADIKRTLKRFSGTKLYEYDVNLIEWSKFLERTPIDTMTFTDLVNHNYQDGYGIAEWFYSSSPYFTVSTANLPQINIPIVSGGSRVFPPMNTFLSPTVPAGIGQIVVWAQGCYIRVEKPDGTTTNYPTPYGGTSTTIDFTDAGTYIVDYVAIVWVHSSNIETEIENTYRITFGVFDDLIALKDWTIGAVIRRLLSSGKTRKQKTVTVGTTATEVGDIQRYRFLSTNYDNTDAPEFFFSNDTMWDALLAIGGRIHAIPRLEFSSSSNFAAGYVGNLVWDKLGQTANIDILEEYSAELLDYYIDEYCGGIDSTVENILTTVSPNEGSLSYPCAGGYITPRADVIRISNDSAMIGTMPQDIGKILSVSINYNNLGARDISAYIYENAAYETLHSYTGVAYPYSKSWALVYTMGGNTISGLQFKAEDVTSPQTAWQKPAIVNIINAVYGEGTITNANISNVPYMDILFNVKYIPYISARILQLRPHADRPVDNVMIYNQGDNTVEGNYFGEKMSGAIARLGNQILVRTYKLSSYAELPRVGQMTAIDGVDYYIAIVSAEYEQNFIKVTLTMTPDYNRLSSYLGLNSNYRQFEVSEKQSYERFSNYGEVCLVGNTRYGQLVNNYPIITSQGIAAIANTFYQQSTTPPISFAETYTFDTDGTQLKRLLLPCSSIGAGRSVAFTVEMQDAYGAGYQSQPVGTMNAVRHLVPFGNTYGRTYAMQFVLRDTLEGETLPSGYAYDLPEYSGSFSREAYFDTSKLILEVDSREIPAITIQQHFIGDSNVEIGAAFSEICPLCTTADPDLFDEDSDKCVELWLSFDKVNAENSPKDFSALRDSFYTPTIGTSNPDPNILYMEVTNPLSWSETYQSWGLYLVTKTTQPSGAITRQGRLIVGRNQSINRNTALQLFFNFLDNNNYRRLTQ